MYYLRELGIKAKNGRKKTFYKNKDYEKVKEVFEKCVKNVDIQDLITFLPT